VLHSYELISRYVMPHFQGSIASLRESQQYAKDVRGELADQREQAMQRAATDYDTLRAARN
jgi:hypothetical protein